MATTTTTSFGATTPTMATWTTTASTTNTPATNAMMDWPAFLTNTVGSALYQQSPSHHYNNHHTTSSSVENYNKNAAAPASLDGYAFYCDGLVLGFQEDKEQEKNRHSLQCQSAHGGETFDCGTFRYNADMPLLSISSSTFGGIASHLLHQDDILLSFVLDNDETACHVVSLDWQQYSLDHYFGLSCPLIEQQDDATSMQQQEHHFALGVSGDVALRSQQLYGGKTLSVRDSYGVYQWQEENDSIRIYFGPQQGRQVTVLEGTLSKADSELVITKKNNILQKQQQPCTHDGTSTMVTVKDLPQTKALAATNNNYKTRSGCLSRLLESWFSKHVRAVQELWSIFKNSWFVVLLGGNGTAAALSVTLTAILSQLFRGGKWTETAMHPSLVPLLCVQKNNHQDETPNP